MRQIILNSIRCPDGTVLVSNHRHDFQLHKQDDGREYFVDGGTCYQRIGFSDNEYKNISVYSDDPHEKIREVFGWTQYIDAEKRHLKKPKRLLLKDMEDSHIKALVEFTSDQVRGYLPHIPVIFQNEIDFREKYKKEVL